MAEDRFANIATLTLAESAAGTLTFQELRTGVGIEPDRKSANAMAIDEIDYFVGVTALAQMTASTDRIDYAITVSNAVTDLTDFSDRRILHSGFLLRTDLGTAASSWVHRMPLVHQFFPPLITADKSLYLGVVGTGLASAILMKARIYHRIVEISQGEFIELAEVFRLVG